MLSMSRRVVASSSSSSSSASSSASAFLSNNGGGSGGMMGTRGGAGGPGASWTSSWKRWKWTGAGAGTGTGGDGLTDGGGGGGGDDMFRWCPVRHENYEHYFMRVVLAITVCRSLPYSCATLTMQPEPNGMAHFMDLTPFCNETLYDFWRLAVFLAAILYATRRWTLGPLLVMTVVHCGIFTLKNSQGWIGHNNQILSLVLLVQSFHFLWCSIKRWLLPRLFTLKPLAETVLLPISSSPISSSPSSSSSSSSTSPSSASSLLLEASSSSSPSSSSSSSSSSTPSSSSSTSSTSSAGLGVSSITSLLTDEDLAVWYSQQAIAATYVISAITKHMLSYNGWIQDSPNLILQLLKANDMGYFNFLLKNVDGGLVANFVTERFLESPNMALWLFLPAYVFEALAFLFLLNRFALLMGGCALIGMHFGISLVMRLNFKYNEAMLFAYYINLPYWVHRFYLRFVSRREVEHKAG